MKRLGTVAELHAWRERIRANVRKGGHTIAVCGTGCDAVGASEVAEALDRAIAQRGLERSVLVKRTGCHGFCEQGPIVVVRPGDIFYARVEPADAAEIVDKSVAGGEIIERLLYKDPVTGERVIREQDIPFYARQTRVLLRDNSRMDPLSLEDYVANDGYAALAKALSEMTPDQVIDEILESGLRGRGGAGFPTGVKWRFCREAPGECKVIVCNADEGDPGAFMDRSLLEGAPHAILEGMCIAAYAIGARRGFVYVRAEYPLAVRHTRIAIEQAQQAGLLGDRILGTGFRLHLSVREGAGAFVCGEETALIASLEGRRGTPRTRPPFPARQGYRGQPTTINNVETLANVPLILRHGKDWYRSIGTDASKGTKIFALAGKVNNTGLVEAPMGATLRQIIFDIGGGIPRKRRVKAVQMGGPSGGCVPAQFLDLPIDYESMKEIGAIMGSGGLIVMDELTCIVDIARFFMEFVQNESCGKCVPCRIGTRHLLDLLTRICEGQGQEGDIERLEELARLVKAGSLCGLGQTAPNPVLSTLRYFREEYEEHIRQRHCRAAACEALVETPCSHACPAGVNVPHYIGLIAEGRENDAVNVVRRRNPFVSVCGRVCDAPCETRCRRVDLDEPLAIRALKRYAGDHNDNGRATLTRPVSGKAEVAIIGSGPAGLACAYFLALLQRCSTVFEALPIPGGMLAVGIPEFRLPKAALQADIDFILSHGVDLRTNTRIGKADALLSQGYRAVFVATGAQTGQPLNIEGERSAGVIDALSLLRRRALGEPCHCGKIVAVVGGGNAAVDAARSALRLGAETVYILYRRTREEMPAYEEEVEAGLAEGLELMELVAPKRIHTADGRVSGIELIKMRLGEADSGGRRRPIPVEGSEFVLPCDMVVPAIGQQPSLEPVNHLVERTASGAVRVDARTCVTSVARIFAGGDCISGGGTVIEAIAAGQRTAVAIDRLLGGSGVLPENTGGSLWRPAAEQMAAASSRCKEDMLPVEHRRNGFAEVVAGLGPLHARQEAQRCMRCDLERRHRRPVKQER